MPLTYLREFFRLEAAGGITLIAASALALILANTTLDGVYGAIPDTTVAVQIGLLTIKKPLLLWINDGMMAVFFFLVGLEIKREFIQGELSTTSQAMLPALAAAGGMAVPAGIYAWLNWNDPVGLHGWAIPAATDIAFALGIMALLGTRAPLSLKIFLTAVAVMDDLGAIVIIALFYTSKLSLISLALGAVAMAALAILNAAGVRKIAPYILIGIVLWVCVLKSGVHATLAGVALALFIPLRGGKAAPLQSPLERLENGLHPWVAFMVLPVFGFANAGVSFAGMGLDSFAEPVTLGIIAGLFLGKQIGIFAVVWLAVKTRIVPMLDGANWVQVYGTACLCGIGFTMSLFIGGLAFDDPAYAAPVRLGVLTGSLLSALLGYATLRYASSNTPSAHP